MGRIRKLLDKSLKSLIIYALVVLSASIPVYYFLVDYIWTKELDEHNEIVADRIESKFNAMSLSDVQLQKSIKLWNDVQPEVSIKELKNVKSKKDSPYTAFRKNIHSDEANFDRFRVLEKSIKINHQPYRIIVETNIEETEETVVYIAAVTFLFYLILVVGFIILTRKLSDSLWKPFRKTLSQLQSFELNDAQDIQFEKTTTKEFVELNEALQKLIDNNIKTYQSQKEFTENASHELQTPLAIIRNKLDLLQQQHLSETQYHLVEDINSSLGKMSKINRNLLLLSKIENQQFVQQDDFYFDELLTQNLELLQDFFDEKHLKTQVSIEKFPIKSNKNLTEILVNNLLTNAIKYAPQDSEITIELNSHYFKIQNIGSETLDKNKLFQRFYKTSVANKGVGLGLAIVHQISIANNWKLNYSFQDEKHEFIVTF